MKMETLLLHGLRLLLLPTPTLTLTSTLILFSVSTARPGPQSVGGDWSAVNWGDGPQRHARASWWCDGRPVLGHARADHFLRYEVFPDAVPRGE